MNWRRTLWILWSASFLTSAGMSLVVPFLPLYIDKLGVHNLAENARWSGWVFSAQFLTSFMFQPLWGSLADKYGRKIMLIRSAVGMGIVTALMGLATSPLQLLILRLLNGLFSGFISMAISLQASVTPDEYSGRALGTLQTGQIAGTLIGPLVGGILVEIFGFKGVFFLTGGLLLLASIVVARFVHEEVTVQANKKVKQKKDWKQLRPLLPVFIATTVTQLGMMSIQPILSLYTKTLYQGNHLEFMAGLVSASTGIANMIGSPTLGRIGDKIGQQKVLILALVMASLSFLPQAFANGIYVLIIGRFLLGLFIGGMQPSLNVLVKKIAPKNIQATAFGVNSSARFLGNLIGPLLGSSIAAAFNFRVVFYITMGFLLLNALTITISHGIDKSLEKSKVG